MIARRNFLQLGALWVAAPITYSFLTGRRPSIYARDMARGEAYEIPFADGGYRLRPWTEIGFGEIVISAPLIVADHCIMTSLSLVAAHDFAGIAMIDGRGLTHDNTAHLRADL